MNPTSGSKPKANFLFLADFTNVTFDVTEINVKDPFKYIAIT